MNKIYAQIKKVLWWILLANLAVAIAKILVGMSINSTSVLADGFHSVTDGSGNIVGLIGIAFASKPVDQDHPYGHAKYEMLGSLIIAAVLVFLSFEIVLEAYSKFMNPVTPNISALSLIVMVSTLAINLFVTIIEHKEGVRLGSTILTSDAMHTRSDVFVTIGVIISLVMVKLGLPIWIDPLVSLVVVAFILKAAYGIFSDSSKILLDSKVIEEEEILRILKPLPQIKGVHDIRSRGTKQYVFIDMHILMDDRMPLNESHELAHQIEQLIQDNYSDLMVQVITHMEPYLEEMSVELNPKE